MAASDQLKICAKLCDINVKGTLEPNRHKCTVTERRVVCQSLEAKQGWDPLSGKFAQV